MQKPTVSFASIVKTVMAVSVPPLMVLSLYVIFGTFTLSHFFYAYAGILLASVVFVYPFLANVTALSEYVEALAHDKKNEGALFKLVEYSRTTFWFIGAAEPFVGAQKAADGKHHHRTGNSGGHHSRYFDHAG